jgi:hypothetical protein
VSTFAGLEAKLNIFAMSAYRGNSITKAWQQPAWVYLSTIVPGERGTALLCVHTAVQYGRAPTSTPLGRWRSPSKSACGSRSGAEARRCIIGVRTRALRGTVEKRNGQWALNTKASMTYYGCRILIFLNTLHCFIFIARPRLV